MTTAVGNSNMRGILSNAESISQHSLNDKTENLPYINYFIFENMLAKQTIPRNYLETQKLEKLRTNFISWLFRLTAKTELSNHTLFNTICLIDVLFSRLKREVIEDPSNFQLLAISCFFLSYKVFEKKTMTVSFVENYLLSGQWGEEDIKRAEIFILSKIDYNLHTVNSYTIYEFYKIIIEKHFSSETLNQINFLVNFTMKQSIVTKEFIFNLSPSEQIRIILNTVFLLLSRLTGLDLTLYEAFFIELSALSDREMNEFEKYSNVLISRLRINEELLEKFTRIQ